MTETISDFIQNISRDIHKAYAVSIKGTSSLVVPQVSIDNKELFTLLNKDNKLNQFIYDTKHLSLLKTSKTHLEDRLPKEIADQIVEYIPRITTQMVTYCRWCLLDYTEKQILDIIHENEFDIMWYDYGTMDYTWARDTITEAKIHLSTVIKLKKNFLKFSKYKTHQPISL